MSDDGFDFYVAHKAGRCADGFERDRGTVRHALPMDGQDARAVCNTSPGRRSAGWSIDPSGTAVTCARCLSRLRARGVEADR